MISDPPPWTDRETVLQHAADAIIDAARLTNRSPWLAAIRSRDAGALRSLAATLPEKSQ